MMSQHHSQIASLTLAYNQEDYLERCLRHVSPYVGSMYVMYSKHPFIAYNPNARSEYHQTDSTPEILGYLYRELANLRVIDGNWNSEDDMRNAGLKMALDAGFKYLLIIDADEFYTDNMLSCIINDVLKQSDVDSWWCRMRVPFKFRDYVIDRDDEYLPVVVRLGPGITFANRRIPVGRRQRLDTTRICFNMGFILSDERMLEKTRTWSHSHQLPRHWYRDKWLRWTPTTEDLHTRQPDLWPGTRKYDQFAYPTALANHPLLRRAPSTQ